MAGLIHPTSAIRQLLRTSTTRERRPRDLPLSPIAVAHLTMASRWLEPHPWGPGGPGEVEREEQNNDDIIWDIWGCLWLLLWLFRIQAKFWTIAMGDG